MDKAPLRVLECSTEVGTALIPETKTDALERSLGGLTARVSPRPPQHPLESPLSLRLLPWVERA